AETWWSKDLSYLNAEVIQRLNAEPANSILLSNMGNDYTNTGDLVSLSYGLSPDRRLFLFSDQPDFSTLKAEPNLLTFRPSKPLKAAMATQGWRLAPVVESAKLWRIQR
ncbi:MAG: glycosyl transferase family 39, partial [Hydrococcus sp. RM1_1_31]|nr:glycosyl transferase family 39 [Hydrococcus sp. RM1_1_31]